ncbi:unnamed protein product [Aphanomyces euteiches]|uniref:Uncharacterized protein n=1 Tax=Aphanomyces euteiches TaxID=100861 RepID=A0A6G0XAX5_9STRA|nr:hypothetical protein Ae201684_006480 [Aphanomyces euteiches]KAH9086436.1 hypothetical protein LEN26_020083 [Aphanomyces euteiches]KAH9115341.1 hypothetical protein AeMF1_010607 [Aphanomyces euteiches]KAH9133515.1 hypothetical protein AeRB84_020418 [Aphanomyces euteiches]KAH9196728.1 hypothetical protein AeNC1_001302 [Aphanomyces euteiches]
MDETEAATDKAKRYEALKKLYEALQADHVELSQRYAAVKQSISRVTNENEYLVDELCRFTESDFDSESDVGEPSEKRVKTEVAPNDYGNAQHERVKTEADVR